MLTKKMLKQIIDRANDPQRLWKPKSDGHRLHWYQVKIPYNLFCFLYSPRTLQKREESVTYHKILLERGDWMAEESYQGALQRLNLHLRLAEHGVIDKKTGNPTELGKNILRLVK